MNPGEVVRSVWASAQWWQSCPRGRKREKKVCVRERKRQFERELERRRERETAGKEASSEIAHLQHQPRERETTPTQRNESTETVGCRQIVA